VDQEVGGSSPPSCTKKINDLSHARLGCGGRVSFGNGLAIAVAGLRSFFPQKLTRSPHHLATSRRDLHFTKTEKLAAVYERFFLLRGRRALRQEVTDLCPTQRHAIVLTDWSQTPFRLSCLACDGDHNPPPELWYIILGGEDHIWRSKIATAPMPVTRRIYVSLPADHWLPKEMNDLKWAIVDEIENQGFTPEVFTNPKGKPGLASSRAWGARDADEVARRCVGTAIIGMARWNFKDGDGEDARLPTEFNHYEGTLARTLGLPTLVLVQKDVKRRVVFDAIFGGFVGEIPPQAVTADG
jgi:hypothetical protein